MRNLTRRELLLLAGCGALARPRVALPSPRSIENNPFEGKQLYVDPDAQAAQWVRANERTRPDDAALIRKIAEQPTAIWSGKFKDDPGAGLHSVMQRAGGAFCVFVAYNIPNRDLGQYSAGGAPSADAYLQCLRRCCPVSGTSERR